MATRPGNPPAPGRTGSAHENQQVGYCMQPLTGSHWPEVAFHVNVCPSVSSGSSGPDVQVPKVLQNLVNVPQRGVFTLRYPACARAQGAGALGSCSRTDGFEPQRFGAFVRQFSRTQTGSTCLFDSPRVLEEPVLLRQVNSSSSTHLRSDSSPGRRARSDPPTPHGPHTPPPSRGGWRRRSRAGRGTCSHDITARPDQRAAIFTQTVRAEPGNDRQTGRHELRDMDGARRSRVLLLFFGQCDKNGYTKSNLFLLSCSMKYNNVNVYLSKNRVFKVHKWTDCWIIKTNNKTNWFIKVSWTTLLNWQIRHYNAWHYKCILYVWR